MTRSPTFSPAAETTTPPQTSGPAAPRLSPPGPTSPALPWRHNHTHRRASLSPLRFPSICRCQVDGAAAAVVAFDPILWTTEFSILVEGGCAGRGISLLPTEVAVRPIREGRLVRILPGWCSEEVTLHLVFTTRRGLAPAVRVFIDYLADHFVFRDLGQRPAPLLA